ncbi:hypothetical protein [Caenispirillum salinarum]|uniref:hypothetical protein n=1 Tax=Caenispirillum salinarum TaxID=859058 RepID=UPI00126770B8|nr:hypothetical protein [Caenispirillum salinarum]
MARVLVAWLMIAAMALSGVGVNNVNAFAAIGDEAGTGVALAGEGEGVIPSPSHLFSGDDGGLCRYAEGQRSAKRTSSCISLIATVPMSAADLSPISARRLTHLSTFPDPLRQIARRPDIPPPRPLV